MASPDEKWFTALHDDLKGLNEKVHRVEVTLAKMEGGEIGAKLDKHQAKIEGLEEFKSKVVGAMVILHSIWAIAVAYIIYRITR